MEVYLASAVVFALAVLGMSVGTIFGRRTFKGSCRGTCGRCSEGSRHEHGHECQQAHGLRMKGE